MSGNRKHIVSIILVVILLMPAVIQIEHHHDHHYNHDQKEKSTTFFNQKCIICDLQFPTFINKDFVLFSISFDYIELRANLHTPFQYLNNPKYSFLLRAPPVLLLA
jgi:hypothetical protein